ncbi:GTPase [Candidatus Wolfebacteria bacterium]|nr:GTPase [Candidatus Wolfebacteria bacterium]
MKLIFVYNADGTFASLIKDIAHKLVSPSTYPCNLCRITYPGMTMQEDWQKFVQSLPHEVIFLHRDEFRAQCPDWKDTPLPAVFSHDEAEIKILIDNMEINKAKSAADLIKITRKYVVKSN